MQRRKRPPEPEFMDFEIPELDMPELDFDLGLDMDLLNLDLCQPAPIPPEMLRRLIQLCHPDKHQGSEAANIATRWLLALKP